MMCVNVSVESIWLVVECINATYQILSTSLPLSVCWILDTGTDLNHSIMDCTFLLTPLSLQVSVCWVAEALWRIRGQHIWASWGEQAPDQTWHHLPPLYQVGLRKMSLPRFLTLHPMAHSFQPTVFSPLSFCALELNWATNPPPHTHCSRSLRSQGFFLHR